MAINPEGNEKRQVSLSVFGGLVTEMAAPDLPEGVSPDCQDVVFVPGSVASRPCLQKVFNPGFPAGGPLGFVPTITYAKSFVDPLGNVENLFLDSNGSLWWEDLTNNPGVRVNIGTVTPGTYAKSVTAFGREYIAVSDGLHGADAPLQWDGTHLDRVTQDGPGAPPNVVSVALPTVSLAASGAIMLTLRESDPANQPGGSGTTFFGINTWTLTSIAGVNVGDPVTIAGYTGASAPMNGTWPILAIFPGGAPTGNLLQLAANLPGTTVFSTAAATGTIQSAALNRQNNVVTATTASAHNLQVGYQAQVANIGPSTVGGGITNITINNETLPGIAQITTSAAHGLRPGASVIISGVPQVAVGGGIASISRSGGITTVATNSNHNLAPGGVVTIASTTLASGTGGFNVTTAVLNIISPTAFTYVQNTQTDAVGTAATGTVSLTWPFPDTNTPTFFEVVSAPSATVFQVSVTYSDGVWGSGLVQFPWAGTFYVSAVLSSTQFQYQQYGPDVVPGPGPGSGTVTPFGQAAPGVHLMQVLFLTRQGYVTRPSPPAQFIANGGQYLSVGNIPIGPPNVVARILAFTGALGATYFYIPVPAQINGQQVSTATQINDNTTTNVLLDFSDPTLFASIAISIPGNNLRQQIVLDGALGFGVYASRLITWGQRNRVQNLLNMGFEGGAFPSSPTLPTGWAYSGQTAQHSGTLINGRFGGQAWEILEGGGGGTSVKLIQSMFEDAYGNPIALPNTQYKVRMWLSSTVLSNLITIFVVISAASTGFGSVFSITTNVLPVGGSAYVEIPSNGTPTPGTIPADLVLQVYAFNNTGAAVTITIDDLSIIYASTPFLDTVLFGSYVNNPEGFDGLSGKFGSSQDQRKVMDVGIIRQTLYLLTQDPSGRIHQTSDNGVTEPVGWNVPQVAANCGLLSAFALTKSQADDSSAAGGEEWFAWASASGARIFGGGEPYKISQEIEPDWERFSATGRLSAWALNDPTSRRIYFALPTSGLVPSTIFVLDYRELDSVYQIATNGPIHTAYSGRLVATDHTRKWTRWTMATNGAVLMYRTPGVLTPIILGGNNGIPGQFAGTGNVYTLTTLILTDDDYGQVHPYYVTYFFPNGDQEQGLQLGGGRKMVCYLTAFIGGTGNLLVTYLCNTLANAWGVTTSRTFLNPVTSDMECGGGSAIAQRIAVKFQSLPLVAQTDNAFNLQKVTLTLKKAAHLPVRGAV